MLLQLSLLTVCAAALLFPSADACSSHDPFKNTKIKCEIDEIDAATKNDIFNRRSPQTMAGKCLFECMLRWSFMLGDDDLINVEKFEKSLRTKRYDSLEESRVLALKDAAIECQDHKHSSENKCESAAKFVECAAAVFAKKGMDPTIPRYTIIQMHRWWENERNFNNLPDRWDKIAAPVMKFHRYH